MFKSSPGEIIWMKRYNLFPMKIQKITLPFNSYTAYILNSSRLMVEFYPTKKLIRHSFSILDGGRGWKKVSQKSWSVFQDPA